MVAFLVGISSGFAEERLEGQVVKMQLTVCSTVPGKVGTCEGTIELEHRERGKAERLTLQVTRDTVLKIGEQRAFLFQLRGRHATVTYVKAGDQPVARSVIAHSPSR